MNQTYLVFLKNLITQQEFVAPAQAQSHTDALHAVTQAYPPQVYQQLTCYTQAELTRIIANLQRWPGVASSVQPTLESLLNRPKTSALPPMPGRQASANASTPAPQQPSTSVIQTLKAVRQTGALGGSITQTRTAASAVAASPAAKKAPVAAPTPAPTPRANTSVISVLKAMRGA